MPIPKIYKFPVERPGFIESVQWLGQPGADEVQLQLNYTDETGLPASISLYALNNPNATLCLPTSKVITDLSEDVLNAHVRMAGLISGTVPGSQEYFDAVTVVGEGNARNFQTPIGDVKVTAVETKSDTVVELTMQKGSQTPRSILVPTGDLADYAFAPSTQLLVVAGAIKKQFPTYIQAPASGKFLTQQQMDDIAAFVMTLSPWI